MIKLLGKVVKSVLVAYAVKHVVRGVLILYKVTKSEFARRLKIKNGLKKGDMVEHNGEYYEVVSTPGDET